MSLTAIVVGVGIAFGQLGGLFIALGTLGLVLVLVVPQVAHRLPGLRLLPSPDALEALTHRLNRIRARTLQPGEAEADPYRAALRRTTRWLYVVEGLLSATNGRGHLSDDAIEVEPADKPWGDSFYRQLGLPPEDEYR